MISLGSSSSEGSSLPGLPLAAGFAAAFFPFALAAWASSSSLRFRSSSSCCRRSSSSSTTDSVDSSFCFACLMASSRRWSMWMNSFACILSTVSTVTFSTLGGSSTSAKDTSTWPMRCRTHSSVGGGCSSSGREGSGMRVSVLKTSHTWNLAGRSRASRRTTSGPKVRVVIKSSSTGSTLPSASPSAGGFRGCFGTSGVVMVRPANTPSR
mmetsp:Transcript_22792/g.41032  ORF Transcript_22792/g.41032 Transcript_22792/m.41032 type:complete len:210 (+) Transcript_22792:186-815(+)